MFRRLPARRVVMIVDNENGVSRVFRVDDSGLTESPGGDPDAVAGELAARDPDLILVNRSASRGMDEGLLDELNRLAPPKAAYAWRQAPGELPA